MYTLGQNGLELGIKYETRDDGHKLVRLGGSECIPLVSRKRFPGPRCDNRHVLEGQPRHVPEKALVGRCGWDGAIVFVDVHRLRFDDVLQATLFEGLTNVYPGIESIRPAFMQCGERNLPEQRQLVAIEHRMTIYAADLSGRYVALSCHNCRVYVAPATREGLADYLQRYAVTNCRTHRALEWAYHAFEALGMTHFWSAELETRRRRFG